MVLYGVIVWIPPFAQCTDGHDHNPSALTICLEGAGIRGALSKKQQMRRISRCYKRITNHDLLAKTLCLLGLER